jgi:hypothetical protein
MHTTHMPHPLATRTDGKRTAASKKKTVKTEEDVEMADADDAAASAPTTRVSPLSTGAGATRSSRYVLVYARSC